MKTVFLCVCVKFSSYAIVIVSLKVLIFPQYLSRNYADCDLKPSKTITPK